MNDSTKSASSSQSTKNDCPDFSYLYRKEFHNGTILFIIKDSDNEDARHILLTADGKITVLFDNCFEYEISDEEYLRKEIEKFYRGLN